MEIKLPATQHERTLSQNVSAIVFALRRARIDLAEIIVDKQTNRTKIKTKLHPPCTSAPKISVDHTSGKTTTQTDLRTALRKLGHQVSKSVDNKVGLIVIEVNSAGYAKIEEYNIYDHFDSDRVFHEETKVLPQLSEETEYPQETESDFDKNLIKLCKHLKDSGLEEAIHIAYFGEGDEGAIEALYPEGIEKRLKELQDIEGWIPYVSNWLPEEVQHKQRKPETIKPLQAILFISWRMIETYHEGYELDSGGGGVITIDPLQISCRIAPFHYRTQEEPVLKSTQIILSSDANPIALRGVFYRADKVITSNETQAKEI